MNLAQNVERSQRLFPDKQALIFEGNSFTYRELDEMSNRVANGLSKLGISRGDRVALFLPNIPPFVAAYLGIQKIGAVSVSMNSALKAEEAKFILNDSGALVLVTTEVLRANIPAEEISQLKPILIAEGEAKTDRALSELMANASPTALAIDMAPNDPAALLYTSGTTGFPKGATLSHGNLVSNIRTFVDTVSIHSDNRILLFLPVSHSYGQTSTLFPGLEVGATLVLHRELEIEEILKSIVDNGVTTFFGVPTIYTLLYEKASAEQMRTIRRYVSGGAPLPLEMAKKWRDKFGVSINEEYGSTETSLACFNQVYKPGSIGSPLEGVEVKIIDPEKGQEVMPGEQGEVVIRGPNVMLGYWNRPTETAQVLKEGWFHTGDIGRTDEEGYFYIIDRIKDMINVGGLKVYPSEVENILYQHPAVAEVAVYGVPEALLGEQVIASIIPGEAVTAEEIVAFCRQNMADFKVPSLVELVDSLPKGRTGKILKKILREQFKPRSSTKRDESSRQKSPESLKQWLSDWLETELALDPETIETDRAFADYGLNSTLAVILAQDLSEWLEQPIEPIITWNFPTIEQITGHLLTARVETLATETVQPRAEPPEVSDFSTVPNEPELLVSEMDGASPARPEPIAIIGMGCRFPGGVHTPESFWYLLSQGVDTVTEIPNSRWNVEAYYDPNPDTPGKMYVKSGSFLEGIDQFDPQFFGISPLEAASLDPQQRLLLEVSWEALEHAGVAPAQLRDSLTGVFVGSFWDDYSALRLYADDPSQIDAYRTLSNLRGLAAGRIAYILGSQGPSMQLDTTCSSSLLAVHLAIQSLRHKECHLALAGGVALNLSPELAIGLCSMTALAPDGRCKTFDAKADGFGLGEGCGMVILKRFSDAIRDGDNIMALIRGSAVNHDGRSNGLTAPNGLAQEALLRQALKNSDLNPAQIQYVETHGTGTSLGDPIEVLALANILGQERTTPLTIGSVKTNLGHLSSAAGIASLIKVVLSLQHAQIPPNLHFTEPNPHIPWDKLPLQVPTEPTPWTGEPKLAGISSFGMSGTNVHLIVEAASKTQTVQTVEPEFQLFVLSAKNEERLQVYALKIRDFLEHQPAPMNFSLANLTYTLQVGRDAMVERLAMVVSDLNEVKEKLTQYAQEPTRIKNCYRGNVKTNQTQSELLLDGRAGKEFLRMIIEDRELTKLARLWVSGVDIDWQLLYPNQKPLRIPLPTYPFAKERHWIPISEPSSQKEPIAKLHPLLGSNTSTLFSQQFTTHLSGDEFYLTNHVVAEQKILPGVAILEMARAAGQLAGLKPVSQLTNVVWARPITVSDTPRSVQIRLYPDGNQPQQIEFEVSTLDDDQQRQVHAQGKLTYENPTDFETVDIEAIQNRCFETWNRAECYQSFQVMGLNYGPSFQTIQTLYRNENEALSRLQLPVALKEGFNDFVLHPSLMDGALQTVIGLIDHTTTPYLPFALGKLEFIKPLSNLSYAFVRRSSATDADIKKFHLSILDDAGQVRVRIEDFSLRALKQQTETLVTMYYQSVWEPDALENQTKRFTPEGTVLLFDTDDNRHSSFKERLNQTVILVMPGESYQELSPQSYSINPNHPADYQKLLAVLNPQNRLPSHIIHLWSKVPFVNDEAALNTQLSMGLFSIFHLSQAIFLLQPSEPIQLLYVYLESDEARQPQYAAVSGFAKTIRLENTKLNYKTVALPVLDNVVEIVSAEFQTSDIEVRYDSVQRWVKHLQEFDGSHESIATHGLKEHGVYLITGGAGGLGFIFAKYLAEHFKAKLVLTGRSALDEEQTDKIQSFNSLGAEILYLQADISKRDDVATLIAQTKSRFKKINGIIHSAGVRKDAFVFNKTTDEIASVLAPKVYGTVYLDEATKNEPLDFFVLFSSVAAVMGNVGQCDYAYANGFLDNFALWRCEQSSAQKRFGKTLSINWPLWQEGGMHVDEQTAKWFTNTLGMQALSTETGIEAFNIGLESEKSQFMVCNGYRQKIRKGLGIEKADQTAATQDSQVANRQLLAKLQPDLLFIASDLLKVNAKDIDPHDDISEYGFDSISFTNFANRINDKYQLEITPAIFFEYPSMGAFSQFISQEYQDRLLDYYSGHIKVVSTTSPFTAAMPEVKLKSRFIEPVTAPHGTSTHNTPIAIIGMSGVMPQSENLEIFWQHLEAGKDLITEVPSSRWDWQTYYGDPTVETNKT